MLLKPKRGRPRKIEQTTKMRFEKVRERLLTELERRTQPAKVQEATTDELNAMLKTVRENLTNIAELGSSGADGQEIRVVSSIPVSKADVVTDGESGAKA